MADEFFNEPQAAAQEPSKIKLGDKEYTQEQLTELAGLGEQYKDIETRQNIKLDRVYPEFTKSRQEIAELKKQVGEFQEFQNRVRGVETQVTPEQMRKQALEQARELGLTDNESVRDIIRQEIQNNRTLDRVNTVIGEATKAGKPNINTEELLRYMSGENPSRTIFGDADKAYKDRFDTELRTWEQTKVNEIKPAGFTTQESSRADKEPTSETPKTKEQLDQALDAFFKSQGGAENA